LPGFSFSGSVALFTSLFRINQVMALAGDLSLPVVSAEKLKKHGRIAHNND
jgi:hypothetical protein